MSECSGRRTTEVILLCGMRSTRARFICALAFASADWINEYDLSAQREILSADGLTFSDLSHLDETDTAAVLAPLKKFERRRFLRAVEDARGGYNAVVTTDNRRQLQTFGTGGRAEQETRLKLDLLSGNATLPAYDKTVPPDSAVPGLAGAQVQVSLNLYHTYALDMVRATVNLHVWVRLYWVDRRLSWDPNEYGGVTQLTFVGSTAALEESQIWVPEVELYSGSMSITDLPRKEVIVYHNGSAFWSRPGEVSSMCELEGLEDFPFDQIRCELKFGGWSRGGSIQNLSLSEDVRNKPLDVTHARNVRFQEYRVIQGDAKRGVDAFSCCPDENGWPYVEFSLIFERAEKHYDVKIIMMNIVLTYLSFCVFLLDPKTGERLQFSVTLLLTIVAADSLVTGIVPVCRPFVWIEWFFLLCWLFNILTIICNIISHYLFYKAPPEVYAAGMPRIAAKLESCVKYVMASKHDHEKEPPKIWADGNESSKSLVHEINSPAAAAGGSGRASLSQPGGSPKLRICRDSSDPAAGQHPQRRRISRQITNLDLEPNGASQDRSKLRRKRSSTRVMLAAGGDRSAQSPQVRVSQASPPVPPARMRSVEEPATGTPREDGDKESGAAAAEETKKEPSVTFAPASAADEPDAEAAGAPATWIRKNKTVRSRLRSIRDFVTHNPFTSSSLSSSSGGRSSHSGGRDSMSENSLEEQSESRHGGFFGFRRGTVVPDTFVRGLENAFDQHAFLEAEALAEQITATDLDPVQAALVRKAFRLLDSMSSMVGEIGPSQMEYFAHHFGRLPTELQETDENRDGNWSIEEFSTLCLGLIKLHGNDKFRMLVEGLLESYAHKMKLHSVYWEGWSLWVDYVSLILLTSAYTISLWIVSGWMRSMPTPELVDHLPVFA